MNLHKFDSAWEGISTRGMLPSVTLRSGISTALQAVPYWRERIKLEVRAAYHRKHTRRWLQLLNSHPVFSELVRDCPRLLYKIYRPYLTHGLPMERRIALLASHYSILFQRGLGPLVAQAVRGGVLLGTIEGKSGAPYQLRLHAVSQLEREGELTLQLCDADGPVYSAAFTFSDLEGVHCVSIGCIQGPKGEHGLDAIRNATRELHGLRPKQLLVALIRQLGFEFGCTQLWLVGNCNRVVRSAMRQGRVRADYDELWNELGADLLPCGDYRLPCEALRMPDMEAIASKKRSEARKRYALLQECAAVVSARLGCTPGAFQGDQRVA